MRPPVSCTTISTAPERPRARTTIASPAPAWWMAFSTRLSSTASTRRGATAATRPRVTAVPRLIEAARAAGRVPGDARLDGRRDVGLLVLVSQLVALEPDEEDHVLDQLAHGVDLGPGLRDGREPLLVVERELQGLDERQDALERRAELVRDAGREEPAGVAVVGLGGLVGEHDGGARLVSAPERPDPGAEPAPLGRVDGELDVPDRLSRRGPRGRRGELGLGLGPRQLGPCLPRRRVGPDDPAVPVEQEHRGRCCRHHRIARRERRRELGPRAPRREARGPAARAPASYGDRAAAGRRSPPERSPALPPEPPSRRAYQRGAVCMLLAMRVLLPDGNELTLDEGASGRDAAAAIGPRLADAAVAVQVDGEVRDLRLPFATARRSASSPTATTRRLPSFATRRPTSWRRRCCTCGPRPRSRSGPRSPTASTTTSSSRSRSRRTTSRGSRRRCGGSSRRTSRSCGRTASTAPS